MRLLMVAESGVAHTSNWAGYFLARGWEVTIVSHTDDPIEGARVVQFPPQGRFWDLLPRERFGGGWQLWLACWWRWRRLLKEVRPHVVHVYYISAEARDFFYYRRARNLIVSTHGADVVFDHPPTRRQLRRVRHLLARADSITATTQFLAQETERYSPRGKKIHVVAFGVDCEKFSPRPRRRSPRAKGVVLGFVKYLTVKYGPGVLLESFALIHQSVPTVRLVLAGSGPMQAELVARAHRLGVADCVEFPGRIPHERVPDLMHQFDIFVMPSVFRSETFGVAAIEASACELPVVASRVGGVPEAVKDGVTGLLVSPGDATALAEACLRLIEDPGERRSLGRAGRRWVLERFSLAKTGAAMLDVYESLLESD